MKSILLNAACMAAVLAIGCAKQSEDSEVKNGTLEVSRDGKFATLSVTLDSAPGKNVKINQIKVASDNQQLPELTGRPLYAYGKSIDGNEPCDIDLNCQSIDSQNSLPIKLSAAAKVVSVDIPMTALPNATREKLLKNAQVALNLDENDPTGNGNIVLEVVFEETAVALTGKSVNIDLALGEAKPATITIRSKGALKAKK